MVTLREITLPESVFDIIADRARSNHLTVEQQVAKQLEEDVSLSGQGADPGDADERERLLMAEIDEGRREMATKGVWLTPEILAEAKAERDKR